MKVKNTKNAEITEIFSSVQGEGIFLGARQIFIRFKKCNLNCVFCDVPKNLKSTEYSLSQLIAETRFLEGSNGPHHSVSLTGGEPLLYADFLKAFLKLLKQDGFKVYLETNGTLPRELSKIIDLVDIIAMDFKLPSSTGERDFWEEHLEFLKIAANKKVFVKAVITHNTKTDDIKEAAALLKKIDRKIPFILQPATPLGASDKRLDSDALFDLMETASQNDLESVRVIPQIHKMLNLR